MSIWLVIPISGGVFNGTARFESKSAAIEHCIKDAEDCRVSDDPEWHVIEVSGTSPEDIEMSFSFGFYDEYEYGADVDPRALCIAEMRAELDA